MFPAPIFVCPFKITLASIWTSGAISTSISICCFWIDKANTVDHVLVIDATTHNRLSSRKSHTVVYSKTLIKIFQSISTDFSPASRENANDICNIIIRLERYWYWYFQSFKQTLVIKDVSSSVDFLDLFLQNLAASFCSTMRRTSALLRTIRP